MKMCRSSVEPMPSIISIPVEVHRAFGLAGGARGERDQADVVDRGVDRVEAIDLPRRARLQATGRRIVELSDRLQAPALRLREVQLVREPRVAQRVAHLR